MNCSVEITRNAEKHMRNLNESIRRRIRSRISALHDDPYQNASKLKSIPGFRQRVGDYRITYEIYDAERVVKVTGIFHRREAYR